MADMKPRGIASRQITHCGDEVVWSYHQQMLVRTNGPHDSFELRSEHDSWDDAFEAAKKLDLGEAGFNEQGRSGFVLEVIGEFFESDKDKILGCLRYVGPAGVVVLDFTTQGSTEPGELLVCVPASNDMVPSKSL